MGLDMYLTKKHYVKNWDFQKPEEQHEVSVKRGGEIIKGIKPERVSRIEEEIMYWRKDNHIHQWFVDNCQDGEDDCREAYISREQLRELITVINKVLEDNSKAEDLLPRQQGFFFGSKEYDEWYFKSLQDTKEVLEDELSSDVLGEYYYSSSW